MMTSFGRNNENRLTFRMVSPSSNIGHPNPWNRYVDWLGRPEPFANPGKLEGLKPDVARLDLHRCIREAMQLNTNFALHFPIR
jgi:hypothetical protein